MCSFTTAGFSDITSLTGGISWDSTVLQFSGVQNLNLPLPFSSSNFNVIDAGSLTYFWFDNSGSNPVNETNGTVIFDVCFEVIGMEGDMSDIDIGNVDNATYEITDTEGPLPVFSTCGLVTAINKVCTFTIEAGDVEAVPGDTFCIPVSTTCFDDILSMQYSMNWDANQVTFDTLINLNQDLPLFIGGNFLFVDPDALTTSWNSPNGLGANYPDGILLYEVCFILNENCTEGTNIPIVFSGDPAEKEVTNGDAEIIPFDCVNGSVTCVQDTMGGDPCDDFSVSLTPTHVDCFGDETGSITVNQMNGNNPFACEWLDQDGNDPNPMNTACQLINVPAGTYSVTITDEDECTATATTTIEQPEAPLEIIAQSSTDASCTEGGTVSITVDGGTEPYNYNWTPMLPNQASHTDLAPNNYSVVVTDDNDCVVSTSLTVGDSGELSISGTTTDIACGIQGAIDITVTGSSNPIIDWKDLAGSPNVEDRIGLDDPGTYTVCVTDSETGCSSEASFEILDLRPEINIVNIAVTDIDCDNETGSITVSCSGGCPTQEFECLINGTLVSECENIGDLPEGMHTYCKREVGNPDNMVCEDFTIGNNIEAFSLISINLNDAVCFGDSATIDPEAMGGCGEYICTLNSEPIDCGMITVPAGEHTYCISDGAGNMECQTFTVSSPEEIIITGTVFNDINSIDITVSPEDDYTYEWVDGDNEVIAITEDVDSLLPGCYTVTATNASNCIASETFCLDGVVVFTDPVVISEAEFNGFGVSCHDACDGIISSDVLLGTPPFTITLYNTSLDSTIIANVFPITNLCPGEYEISMEDTNGAPSDTLTFTITAPPELVVALDTLICESEPGALDGAILTTVSGGVPMYTYTWSPDGPNGPSLTNVGAGNYTLQVVDDNQCVRILTDLALQDCNMTETLVPCYEGISVITPNADGFNDLFIIECILNGDHTGSELEVYDRYGRLVYDQLDYDNTWNGIDSDNTELIEGAYYWVLKLDFMNGESQLVKGTVTLLRG